MEDAELWGAARGHQQHHDGDIHSHGTQTSSHIGDLPIERQL